LRKNVEFIKVPHFLNESTPFLSTTLSSEDLRGFSPLPGIKKARVGYVATCFYNADPRAQKIRLGMTRVSVELNLKGMKLLYRRKSTALTSLPIAALQ